MLNNWKSNKKRFFKIISLLWVPIVIKSLKNFYFLIITVLKNVDASFEGRTIALKFYYFQHIPESLTNIANALRLDPPEQQLSRHN